MTRVEAELRVLDVERIIIDKLYDFEFESHSDSECAGLSMARAIVESLP